MADLKLIAHKAASVGFLAKLIIKPYNRLSTSLEIGGNAAHGDRSEPGSEMDLKPLSSSIIFEQPPASSITMYWRTIVIFLGCVIMIGATAAMVRIMGNDLRLMNRHHGVLIKEYGEAVAIGLPALFFLGGVVVICGYIFLDDDTKMRSSGKRRREEGQAF